MLDVSTDELAKAKSQHSDILTIKCNVASFDDCAAAYKAVVKGFPGSKISFLFK